MILKNIASEYGMDWVVLRLLYSIKIKLMTVLPFTEKFFEKRVEITNVKTLPISVERLQSFLRSLPDDKKNEIIRLADKAANGFLMVFSSFELDYGRPINWHYNPIAVKTIDKKAKWYQIRDFDQERGDIKTVWEASRFTHFLTLARAYLITDDLKYYQCFSKQLSDWIRENPYSYGCNYKCGQECSIRMMNALLAYSIFHNHITKSDESNMKQLISRCYKKVLSNFFYAHRCIRNNHTLSEICGMMIGSCCCDDEKGLKKAYSLMNQEILRQFKPDGGYIQYSFNYQRVALQIMEFLLKLGETTGMKLSKEALARVKNSALLLYNNQDETGDVPNYGSNDGALLFPLHCCGYRDFTPAINTIYALVSGKTLYQNGFHTEELLWFGQNKDYPYEEYPRASKKYPDAGIYVLRKASGFCTTYLSDYRSRPYHMDGLHMDIWDGGRNILCDSGTYSYSDEAGKQLIRTGAHNTLKIRNKEQMSSYGIFLIYQWYEAKNIFFSNHSFQGTLVSKMGYEHTRKILMSPDGYRIIDTVRGTDQLCELHFHMPYQVELTEGEARIFDQKELIGSIRCSTGEFELRKTYRSIYYLKKDEINEITLLWDPRIFPCIEYDIIISSQKEGLKND